jgi:hypothetical protein
MDKTPTLVVAIAVVAVVKHRLGNAHRSCSSGSVSVSVMRRSWRSCIDAEINSMVADESVDFREHVAQSDDFVDLELPLRNCIVQHGLLHVYKAKKGFFALTSVPA